jgi:uncharacterized protein YjbJ (UPF0337 family)
MNWDRIEGSWEQFTGDVREKWGEADRRQTDDRRR